VPPEMVSLALPSELPALAESATMLSSTRQIRPSRSDSAQSKWTLE
jgi:hypothetical protein